jgi:hypothetical protein
VTNVTVGRLGDQRHSADRLLAALMDINNTPQPRGNPMEPKMTAAFTKTIRQAALVLAFATSFSALASTSSFAFSAESRSACQGDAFRLCSSEIPNIARTSACMLKRKAELSVGCRTAVDRELGAPRSSKVANQ